MGLEGNIIFHVSLPLKSVDPETNTDVDGLG